MEPASSATKAHALANDADPAQGSLKLPQSPGSFRIKSGTHRGVMGVDEKQVATSSKEIRLIFHTLPLGKQFLKRIFTLKFSFLLSTLCKKYTWPLCQVESSHNARAHSAPNMKLVQALLVFSLDPEVPEGLPLALVTPLNYFLKAGLPCASLK